MKVLAISLSLLVLPSADALARQVLPPPAEPGATGQPAGYGRNDGAVLVASQPILSRPLRHGVAVGARSTQTSRSTARNREIERMEEEREALERQLQELEGAGTNSETSASDEVTGTASFDPVGPITDPIEDALGPAGSAIGDAIGGIEDGLGDLLGGSSGETEAREPTVDHRTGRTPPRRNETVTARRGRLPAPSNLVLRVDTPTSIAIAWQDNARSEHGVHVERSVPVRERGGVNYDWRRIFSSEERVESRVRNTGARSDVDDGLVSGTHYCYRLRAYRADQVSAYTQIACVTPR